MSSVKWRPVYLGLNVLILLILSDTFQISAATQYPEFIRSYYACIKTEIVLSKGRHWRAMKSYSIDRSSYGLQNIIDCYIWL